MPRLNRRHASGLLALAIATQLGPPASAAPASEAAPPSFDVANRSAILSVHAEGVQLYECRPEAGGGAVWTFREPIATLIADGKTIGRHYVGPTWQLDDGEAIKAKLAASAPGAGAGDVPLLKLDVSEHRGAGALSAAKLVLRLNTHGGGLKGACAAAGALRAEPYSADYVFLR